MITYNDIAKIMLDIEMVPIKKKPYDYNYARLIEIRRDREKDTFTICIPQQDNYTRELEYSKDGKIEERFCRG